MEWEECIYICTCTWMQTEHNHGRFYVYYSIALISLFHFLCI